MSYQDKYIKYKNKYINLKKQLGGEPATLLYHGTSSYYFDSIKVNGLPGKFPEDLLADIKTAYNAGYGRVDPYVGWFLDRQIRLDNNNFSLSLTGDLSVAEEYSNGARQGGEGLSRMVMSLFGKTLSPELQIIANKLSKVSRYPGIILVVKVDEIKDNMKSFYEIIPEDGIWEHTIHFKIPPEKLYLRKNDGVIIKILSQEADIYIKSIISQFEEENKIFEEEKKIAEEKRRLYLIEEEKRRNANTITEKFENPKKKEITFISKDWKIELFIGDIKSFYPEYLQLNVHNQGKSLYFSIKNDKMNINNELETRNEVIIQKLEFLQAIKDTLSIMFNKLFDAIEPDRKDYYSKKIKEVFKI
jgi:hypothetical protein